MRLMSAVAKITAASQKRVIATTLLIARAIPRPETDHHGLDGSLSDGNGCGLRVAKDREKTKCFERVHCTAQFRYFSSWNTSKKYHLRPRYVVARGSGDR